MYYTIYKTYNLINGKEYIGKHQTKNINDNYLGSGKILCNSIVKYGKANFVKDILYVFNTELEMNNKEKELVTESYVNCSITYNLCSGGHGGFGYINSNNHIMNNKIRINNGKIGGLVGGKIHKNKMINNEEYRKYRISNFINKCKSKNKGIRFKNKKHSDKTKRQMSEKAKLKIGSKNSQFGTCWITNGTENKKIRKEELALYINQGYYKGRIMSRGPVG